MTDAGREHVDPVDEAPVDDTVEQIEDAVGSVTDPATADVPEGGEAPAAEAEVDPLSEAQRQLDERTQDLQRLQAEYLNYKRRVERDRELITENATFKALAPVVEVLDTVDRARESGEVEGGFKAVVDQLERAVAQAGVIKYTEPGDPFDPLLHEALSHMGSDPDVEVTTVKVVAKAGYRIGDRVVRAAQVLVVDPVEG